MIRFETSNTFSCLVHDRIFLVAYEILLDILDLHKMPGKKIQTYSPQWWFDSDLPWYNPQKIALIQDHWVVFIPLYTSNNQGVPN